MVVIGIKRIKVLMILVLLIIITISFNKVEVNSIEQNDIIGYVDYFINDIIIANNNIFIKEQIEKEKFIYESIPLKYEYSGVNKSYMSLDCISYINSKQYQMKSKYSLDEKGHYYYESCGEKFYVVALGNYFGEVGDMFKIELSSGIVFYAIKGDTKKDEDTYERYAHKGDYSVIEFIINENVAINYYGADNGYVCNGNFNNSELWNGSITNVEKILY